MKLLMDTCAYVGLKLGDSRVADYLTRASVVLVSPVVQGELLFGFRRGAKLQRNLEEWNQFLAHDAVETISIGEITADRYARIADQLKQRGSPIPTNDIWIAAQAMEHGAELVTMDRHFEKIEGLVFRLFPT